MLTGPPEDFVVLMQTPVTATITEPNLVEYRVLLKKNADGVPFEILDPLRLDANVLVLKGGMAADWESKLLMPQEVEPAHPPMNMMKKKKAMATDPQPS